MTPLVQAGRSAPVGMFLAGLGVLTFSLSVPLTKIAVRGLDPWFASVGRAAAAGVLALAILVVVRPPRPARRLAGRFAVVIGGAVFGFPMLTAYAVRRVPSTHGVIVIGLLPLATAACAVVRAGERPPRRAWVCTLVGVVAVVGYALHDGGGSLHLADGLLVIAVLAAAIAYTEGAMLARNMPGWQVMCWALVVALPVSIPLTLLAPWPGTDVTTGQWLAFGYTVGFSALLGFFAWYAGLARAGIARGGQIQLLQPVLSVLWAWPLLGERPNAAAVLAAAVVLGAVVIGRRRPDATGPSSSSPVPSGTHLY